MVRLALSACVLALGACAVGPDYEAPDIDAPEAFEAAEVVAIVNDDDAAPALATAWWRGFSDPLLSAFVADAIERNYEIAAAAANVRAAEAAVAAAEARDAPKLDAGTDTRAETRQFLSDDGDDVSGRTAAGTLGVALAPDLFGRTRRRVEAAEAAREAARHALAGLVLTRSADVARTYLQYRGTERQLELLRESVALQEKTLKIVRSRYEAGLSPELDLRRAETSVERLRADIPPLERTLADARQQLAVLTGRYPGTLGDALGTSAGIPDYTHRIDVSIPAAALRRRPDVRQAEADLKQAVAGIGVAEAEFFPLVSLFADVTIATGGIGFVSALDRVLGTIGATVQQRVFDGGTRAADVDAARARADAALAIYRQRLVDAARQIEATLNALEASLARQEALDKAVAASGRSFEQAERLYQLGLSSFLDVVDAQRVQASAEQALATERTNYATQIATLFEVLGADTGPGSEPLAADESASATAP